MPFMTVNIYCSRTIRATLVDAKEIEKLDNIGNGTRRKILNKRDDECLTSKVTASTSGTGARPSQSVHEPGTYIYVYVHCTL
jgi:hypothetical protein